MWAMYSLGLLFNLSVQIVQVYRFCLFLFYREMTTLQGSMSHRSCHKDKERRSYSPGLHRFPRDTNITMNAKSFWRCFFRNIFKLQSRLHSSVEHCLNKKTQQIRNMHITLVLPFISYNDNNPDSLLSPLYFRQFYCILIIICIV